MNIYKISLHEEPLKLSLEHSREDRNFAIKLEKVDDSEMTMLIADPSGTITCHCKNTPKMFGVDAETLKGCNFFTLISRIDRKYFYETFGENIFKSFVVKSKTIRYATPYQKAVTYDQYNLLVSKIVVCFIKLDNAEDPHLESYLDKYGIDK